MRVSASFWEDLGAVFPLLDVLGALTAFSMSVRDIEKAVKAPKTSNKAKSAPRASQKDADTRILESDLSRILGMGVVIDHDPNAGGGKLSIKYKDLSQLDDLLRLLNTT